ncbi:MAG TPA: prolipoprotein diacylglyceryl transferase [Candidatus Omnitrophota bacterium]|nr:prolipoprotein diacylglyceryl transferase [Candidatus Omnitrophota bacterium]HPS37467.1 prolipoprotein diacylglyceryl transferase [Candidatus Omnitrophota bacterium]
MIPVLLSIGPLHLYSYGVCIALGVLLSVFLMTRRAVREGFPAPDDVLDISFWTLVWGFAGARFSYIGQNFSYYLAYPLKIVAVWEGGLIVYGGLLAGLLGFYLTARKKKIPFWKMLDFIVPYTALSQAFGRIGCFLNGCCFGKECGFPWAVRFPDMAYAVHPAQLYEAAFDLFLFVFLLSKRKSARFEGQIALLYFAFYGFGRYMIEFFREPNLVWLGLSSGQWTSILAVTAAFGFFMFRQHQTRRKKGR